MANKKTLKVFSTAAVAGMIAAAVVSSQAFAAVDAYSVKVGDSVYKYDKAELTKAFLQVKTGEKSALYDDFTAKLSEAKGFYAFEDSKNGFVDYSSIQAKFLEAKANEKTFDVDAFAESKDAKVVEIATVKKAVVNKDGKVEYKDETSKGDPNAEVSIKSIEALNLKQVKINFAKAVTNQDKIDDVEDEDNYTLENSDRDELKDIIDKVEMDESGKFAILTFKDSFDKNGKYERQVDTDKGIVNQEKYKLTIDENVTGKEVVENIKFDDSTRPEVEGIEVVGNDTIKVKFSEPIKPYERESTGKELLKDESFKINNDDINVNKAELVNKNKEVNIKVGSTLKDGEELKVEVRGIIEDYAGFGVKAETKTVKVKADKEPAVVVGAKKVKKGEVTLVFDKDIKFKGSDDKIKVCKGSVSDFFEKDKLRDYKEIRSTLKSLKDDDKFDEYYHTNEKDKAFAVKIDGKELTMYFDEKQDGIPNGSARFYIKSGELETLWEKENNKVSYEVRRDADTSAPEVKSVEQDEDDAKIIKVKFNKELDREEAEKKNNYELKDKKGNKITIKDAEYDDSDKEVKITTNKKLEDEEYKLTIEGVEDKYGNVMKTVTKKLSASKKDAVKEDDVKVYVYNAGENKQKLVVDFDTKMKTGKDKYSIEDLAKYTLVARDKDGNQLDVFKGKKSAVTLDKLYNPKAKAISDNNKVEITLPYKSNKDDSYDLTKHKDKDGKIIIDGHEVATLELQIGKVSDADGNKNDLILKKNLYEEAGTIDVKNIRGDRGVRAISTDEIEVTLKDKVNIKQEDFSIVAVPQDLAKEIIDKGQDKHAGYLTEFNKVKDKAEKVEISKINNKDDNGKTVVSMILSKNPNKGYAQTEAAKYDDSRFDHVLNYDGTIGEDHKVLFVMIEEGKSKNDYDAKLTTSVHRVLDNIAPALIDNDKRDDRNNGRFVGSVATAGKDYFAYSSFKNLDNKDEAVEYYRSQVKNDEGKLVNEDKGAIVLTFEEKLEKSSVTKNTFTLDKDSDFKKVRIDDAYVSDKDATKVIIEVSNLNKIDEDADSDFGTGFIVEQNAPIRDASGNQFVRGEGNQVEDIKTEIGNFDKDGLSAEVAKAIGVKSVIKDAEVAGNKKDIDTAIAKVVDITDLAEEPTIDNVKVAVAKAIGNADIKVTVKQNADGKRFDVTLEKGTEKSEVKTISAAKKAVVDTSSIDTSIAAANKAKKDVKTSADGTDVAKAEKWVTEDAKNTLEAAITAATNAKGTVKSTAEAEAAAKVLDNAVKAYTPAAGTKADAVVVDTSSIDTSIAAANKAKKDVKTSADGTDVAKAEKWVTEDAKNTLEAAITAATNAKGTVKSTAEAEAAAKVLDNAVKAYTPAAGTK